MSCLGGFHDAQLQPSFAWSSRTAKFISRSVAMSFHNCHLPRGWRNDKSFPKGQSPFKAQLLGLLFCAFWCHVFWCLSVLDASQLCGMQSSESQERSASDKPSDMQMWANKYRFQLVEMNEERVGYVGHTWWHSNLFRQTVMLHNCHEIWNKLSCIHAIASQSRYFRCFQWHPSLIVRRSEAETFALNSTSVVLWLSQITQVNHNTRLAFQHHEP